MGNIVEYPHVELIDECWRIKGTRVPATRLFFWHKKGTTFDTLFKRYPQLGPARILSAVAFCYDNQIDGAP